MRDEGGQGTLGHVSRQSCSGGAPRNQEGPSAAEAGVGEPGLRRTAVLDLDAWSRGPGRQERMPRGEMP